MTQYIRNLNLTWIKNNKDLALNFLLIGCIAFLFLRLEKARDNHEDHLKEDVRAKEEDLKTARQNFENSQQLLRLIKEK